MKSYLYKTIKHVFDITVSVVAFGALLPVFLFVSLAVKMTSHGPVFHSSNRVGKDNKFFLMVKFRTMLVGAPHVATHLMTDPEKYLTPIGCILRKTSLDELPQLLNVLKGDMSLVGPRPALFNQNDLISLRTEKGIHRLIPGITGWAQVNGRDELLIPEKVDLDAWYLANRSLKLDFIILCRTFVDIFKSKNISH